MRFDKFYLLILACWLWGSSSVALAAPDARVAPRPLTALHLAIPQLLQVEPPQGSEQGPSSGPTSRPLDGIGLAIIAAVSAGVGLSALTIRSFDSDAVFEPSAARTTAITAASISALGITGWAFLRARHGPLTLRRRVATLLVFGATYAVITGVAGAVWILRAGYSS